MNEVRCYVTFQQELEKYSHDKNHVDERSDHNSETLRNALEILLADTLRKLIRTEKCISTTFPIELTEKNSMSMNESSVEENNNVLNNHLSSLKNVVRQKDEEMEKLKYT